MHRTCYKLTTKPYNLPDNFKLQDNISLQMNLQHRCEPFVPFPHNFDPFTELFAMSLNWNIGVHRALFKSCMGGIVYLASLSVEPPTPEEDSRE